MRNSVKFSFPISAALGEGKPAWRNFDAEVEGWLPLLLEVDLPPLTCADLAGVVRRETATAGSLDGWSWRELKALPEPWFDELARILAVVEEGGIWPEGLLDASIAQIPKAAGDAAPLGQRSLCARPVLYRIWASARMV